MTSDKLLERYYASSRHPFEVYTLISCVLVGVPLLLGHGLPDPISALLPSTLQFLWALLLTFGGAIALLGIVWPNRVTGLIMEQVGLVSTGCACLVYGVAVTFGVPQHPRLVAGGFVVAFGCSCFMRYLQLRNILRMAQARLAARRARGND